MRKSEALRKVAPELDPLRLGTNWKAEDLDKVPAPMEIVIQDQSI